MLSGNGDHVQNEAMIGGAESERSLCFVWVCVSVRDRVYGIRSDAACLGVTMLQRQRRHGRGGMPWSALYLCDCETYNRSFWSPAGYTESGISRLQALTLVREKACAAGWNQETADLVWPDRLSIVQENCTNALPKRAAASFVLPVALLAKPLTHSF